MLQFVILFFLILDEQISDKNHKDGPKLVTNQRTNQSLRLRP